MRELREPFDYEQHQDAAALLNRVTEELDELGQDLDRSYGANAVAAVIEAKRALDNVRSVLDGQLGREFQREGAGVCQVRLGSIYFPPRWRDQQRAG